MSKKEVVNNPKLSPYGYQVVKKDDEREFVEEFTYIPSTTRKTITPLFDVRSLIFIVEGIKTALLEGGTPQAFEKIDEIQEDINKVIGVEED